MWNTERRNRAHHIVTRVSLPEWKTTAPHPTDHVLEMEVTKPTKDVLVRIAILLQVGRHRRSRGREAQPAGDDLVPDRPPGQVREVRHAAVAWRAVRWLVHDAIPEGIGTDFAYCQTLPIVLCRG